MRQTLKTLMVVIVLLVSSLNLNLFSQLAEKKLEFEVSGGLSFIHRHDALYSKITGVEGLLNQYAGYYGLQVQTDPPGEEIGQIGRLVPTNLSMNYQFTHRWYLKIGFEYSTGKTLIERQYSINWSNAPEVYDYRFDYKLSSLMPFVGVETRFSNFALYSNLGFNITDFTFTQDFEYSSGSNGFSENEIYDVKGKSIALMLGAKYTLELGKSLKILLKAEYLYLNIASFTGEKQSSTGTIEGTLYTYKMNPYNIAAVDNWEIFATPPGSGSGIPGLSDVKELGLDLSCIRLMIGFTF